MCNIYEFLFNNEGNRGYGGGNRYGGGGNFNGKGGSRDNDGRATTAEDWTIPLPRNERIENELFGNNNCLNFATKDGNIFKSLVVYIALLAYIFISGAGGHEPSGINFDRYEDIPVEATGSDVPSPIEDVSNILRFLAEKFFQVISL